ncbi:MAG: hypothetical protein LIO75_06260 [Lachnospiraceae bacterium]|nr:hypothetical protein [Lachnospiraceae bacterium]
MKKQRIFTLFAALTAGSLLLLNGCGVDLTSINADETALSAELESENLSDGTLLIHSIWYNSDGSRLTDAEVVLSSADGELFSGTTDESGCLDECTLPGNTAITCEITDSSGDVIAEAEILFKLSADYSDLTIYTSGSKEDSQCILEIPTDKTDIRATVFLTEDGSLVFANLTPYTGSDETADGETAGSEDGDAAAENGTDADGAADEGGDAAAENGADTDSTADESGDAAETTDQGDGTAEEDAAAGGDAAEGEAAGIE